MDEQSLAPMETATATEPTPATEPEPVSEPVSGSESEPQPEISLGEDGEVQFSDGFFGEVEAPQSPQLQAPVGKEPAGAGEAVSPTDYTDDELRDTPWEQWDADRISGDVKRYIPILQEQLRRREAVRAQMAAFQGQMAQPQQGMQYPQGTQPAPLPAAKSDKEIAAAAAKAAKQRLGLGEDDELDFYEPEHVAALAMAAQELKAQDQAQIARATQIRQQQQQFGAFAADLAARPDFAKFDQWVTQKLAAAGMHPQQLQDYALQTGDIAGVQRTIAGWWQAWRQQAQPQPAQKQVPKVPAVETANGAVAGKKVINLRDFGEMDEDEQAMALIEAGLV